MSSPGPDASPRALARDERGAALIGWALILPVLLALSFGILETTLAMFSFQRASEAARVASRAGAIVDRIANLDALAGGGSVICTGGSASVSCSGGTVVAPAGFAAVVAAAQQVWPGVQGSNIELTYEASGIGDASTPGGIVPIVQVRLLGLQYPLAALGALPGMPDRITLPAFASRQIGAGSLPN